MKFEPDMMKTAAIVVVMVGVYGGVVFWPAARQNKALAGEVKEKRAQLEAMPRPNLSSMREQITSLRAELRERSVTLPEGELHDRVLHHVSDTLIDRGVTLYDTSYEDAEHYKRFSMTPIDVSFESRFSSAFHVIRRIENEGPPVRIERLNIQADAVDPISQVEVEMQMSSFFLPTQTQGGEQ